MSEKFTSVWDALEDDPVKAENMKLRSILLIAVTEHIKNNNLKQAQVAKALGITQPRVSALCQGKIEMFRLDTLVDFAHKFGLNVKLEVAA